MPTVAMLTGAFIVEEGATLIIPAGTQIIAEAGGTDVYIAILKGAKININGTGSNTSNYVLYRCQSW